VRGFAVQQREHGLVATVHAVEVANGQRAGRRDVGVVETTKDFHWFVMVLVAACARGQSAKWQFVIKSEYIVPKPYPGGVS